MRRYIRGGERSTWPKLGMVGDRQLLEEELQVQTLGLESLTRSITH